MIWRNLKMDARYKTSGMTTISVIRAVGAVHPSEAASKDLDSEGWIPAFAPALQSASARRRGNDSVEENFWVFVIPAVGGGDPSEKGRDGFPMTNVGNYPAGNGCPIKYYEADPV
jgi:hypothetical protein